MVLPNMVEGGGLFGASPLTLRVAAEAALGAVSPPRRTVWLKSTPSTTPVLYSDAVTNVLYIHLVEGGGFEPPKLARQIYSLIPLATREPLRKAAYCPDAPCPCQPVLPLKLSTYDHPRRGRPAGAGHPHPGAG